MRWFRRPTPQFITINPPAQRERISKDIWYKCEDGCDKIVRRKDWIANWKVCPHCGKHSRIDASERIDLLLDEGSFNEIDQNLVSADPLKFSDGKPYPERVEAARKKTGRNDALVSGRATIGEVPVAIAIMEFPFMGGSMGCVVGEKVARTMELAIAENRACITIASTGGARMQEGALSLMQLAKTSIMCKKLQEKGIPFISILADPSTAGIMASFASLGDVTISEPGAYVGFAGRRVIEATIRQTLPDNFQTAEFVRDHGFIDLVVHRHEMRGMLITLLRQMRSLPPGEFEDEPPVNPRASASTVVAKLDIPIPTSSPRAVTPKPAARTGNTPNPLLPRTGNTPRPIKPTGSTPRPGGPTPRPIGGTPRPTGKK